MPTQTGAQSPGPGLPPLHIQHNPGKGPNAGSTLVRNWSYANTNQAAQMQNARQAAPSPQKLFNKQQPWSKGGMHPNSISPDPKLASFDAPASKVPFRDRNTVGAPDKTGNATYQTYLPWWMKNDFSNQNHNAQTQQGMSQYAPNGSLYRYSPLPDPPAVQEKYSSQGRSPSCPPSVGNSRGGSRRPSEGSHVSHPSSHHSSHHTGGWGTATMTTDNMRSTVAPDKSGYVYKSASMNEKEWTGYSMAYTENRPAYSLEDLETILRTKVQQKTKGGQGELRNVYKLFDRDHTSKITRSNIRDAAIAMGIELKEEELDVFMENYANSDGIIPQMTLLNRLLNPSYIQNRRFQGKANPSLQYEKAATNLALRNADIQRETYSTDQVVKLIRDKVRERTSGGAYELREAFRIFDKDGSGRVDGEEIKESCLDFNLVLKDEEIEGLMALFASEGADDISCVDFVHHVLGPAFTDPRGDNAITTKDIKRPRKGIARAVDYDYTKSRPVYDLKNLEQVIRTRLNERIPGDGYEMRESVKIFDRRGTGYINRDELIEACAAIRVILKEEEANEMMEKYADSRLGINVKPFLLEIINPQHIRDRRFQGKGMPTLYYDQTNAGAFGVSKDRIMRRTLTEHEVYSVLREKVRERTRGGAFELREAFRYFDKDGSGFISGDEIQEVCMQFNFPLKQEELDAVVASLAPPGETEIPCRVFIDKVLMSGIIAKTDLAGTSPSSKLKREIVDKTKPRATLSETFTDKRAAYNIDDIENIIRQKIQERTGGINEKMEALKLFDKNRSGVLTAKGLKEAMLRLGIEMKDDELQAVISFYGGDKNRNSMNIHNFISQVMNPAFLRNRQIQGRQAPQINVETKSINALSLETINRDPFTVEELEGVIREKIVERTKGLGFEMREAFKFMDRDGRGIVNRNSIKELMLDFNVPLTNEEVDRLIEKYDPEGKGWVQCSVFIQNVIEKPAYSASMALAKKLSSQNPVSLKPGDLSPSGKPVVAGAARHYMRLSESLNSPAKAQPEVASPLRKPNIIT